MTWHDRIETRKQIGDALESLFKSDIRCACGGKFEFIGGLRPGFPDFTCDHCGRLVDVKSSPQSERTGNIAVSATPWQHYADDTLLVTLYRGKWVGQYKGLLQVNNQVPYEPTHNSSNTRFRNTRFHLISLRQFRPINQVGLIQVG